MKLQRLEGGLYLIPDHAASRIRSATAGPFKDKGEAYRWMIEKVETSLNPAQMTLWNHCLELAGGMRADLAQMLAVIGLIKRNRSSEEFILKSSRPVFG